MLYETGTKILSIEIFIIHPYINSKHIPGWPNLWNFGCSLKGRVIFITQFCIFKYVNYARGKKHNERNVHQLCVSVGHLTGAPAPRRKIISSLTNSVCQGHTHPLFLVPILKYFTPWPESPALSSRCFSNSFHEMWIWFIFVFLQIAYSSSLKYVLRCHTSTGMVGLCKQTLSFRYQPATFPAIYFELLPGTYHEKQIHAHLQGSPACRASAPCICQDIGNCRRNSVWLLDSVLLLYRVGGWMNETRAWSPHSSCWDCSRNFRAFSVSSQKRKPTEKPSPWNTKYFLEVYSTERLILKRLYMLSLKQVGLIFSLTNSKIYVPQSVVFTLVLLTVVHIGSPQCLFCACPLDRQTIPKGHLRLFFKTMEAPLQLPVDCSVHYFIMKMFSPSAIIRESQETPILFRSAYPLLKRSKMIKKSHPKFPFKVV